MKHEIVIHKTYKKGGKEGPRRLYVYVEGININDHVASSKEDIYRIKKNYETSFNRAFALVE